MSCNGCRILRKGCSDDCIIRPCLQWIPSSDSQANATIFLAKFYGRAGLFNLITAAAHHLRPGIYNFFSLSFFFFFFFFFNFLFTKKVKICQMLKRMVFFWKAGWKLTNFIMLIWKINYFNVIKFNYINFLRFSLPCF